MGGTLRALDTCSSVFPRIDVSRVEVMSSAAAPPRRRRFSVMSVTRRAFVAASATRARNESRPPTSAQRGRSDAPTDDPEAVYGYWLAETFWPAARAAST